MHGHDDGMTADVPGPLWEAYLRTQVRVDLAAERSIVVEQVLDPVTDRWPLTSDAGCVITACNPRSIQLSREENAMRTRQLHDELAYAGYRVLPATGFDPANPDWSEPGWLVEGISESEAMRVARKWEQNAVFEWTPTSWDLVGVLIPHRHRHSWRIVEQPG